MVARRRLLGGGVLGGVLGVLAADRAEPADAAASQRQSENMTEVSDAIDKLRQELHSERLFTELTGDAMSVGTKVVTDEMERDDKKKKGGSSGEKKGASRPVKAKASGLRVQTSVTARSGEGKKKTSTKIDGIAELAALSFPEGISALLFVASAARHSVMEAPRTRGSTNEVCSLPLHFAS